MRVQIVDPPAYTPPYDRSLGTALARAGAQVELVTGRFVRGSLPEHLANVLRCSWDAIATQHLDLYRELTGG